jgi:ubiquinone/menaquinone biosynthesis C-methylase UbiE
MMQKNTSWNKVADWYDKSVGEKGSFYHEQVILPNVARLMNLQGSEMVVDMGCGQGVLARSINPKVKYLGIDVANDLVNLAEKYDKNYNHKYIVADVTREIRVEEKYDWATMILAIQNFKSPFKAIQNTKNVLKKGGRLLIVLNHPTFRVPKHSNWMVNENRQYRVVDSYMSPLEIPIDSSPYDNRDNKTTYSYHYPLSAYCEMLSDNGFLIERIEEWVSPKKSEGGMAQIEDKARKEIPLFMAILAMVNPPGLRPPSLDRAGK